MSMILYDIKQGKKWLMFWGVCAVAFFVVVGSATAIWHKVANPNQDLVGDQGRPQVGLDVYATATFEVFDCIAEGSACDRFDSAKESLTDMTAEFEYTPFPGVKSPGKAGPDGTKSVALDSLSDKEWQQVGRAVMRDGQVTTRDVAPERMKVHESDAHFSISSDADQHAVKGVVGFESSGKAQDPTEVHLLSVTYSEGG